MRTWILKLGAEIQEISSIGRTPSVPATRELGLSLGARVRIVAERLEPWDEASYEDRELFVSQGSEWLWGISSA
jgi:hypothetical protein